MVAAPRCPSKVRRLLCGVFAASSLASIATDLAVAQSADSTELADLDARYKVKGWNIHAPDFADTITKNLGGYRSMLAEYGIGITAIELTVGASNLLNTPSSGPGPSNGPGRGFSNQEYWGQRRPSADTTFVSYITYDLSRWGIPDGQLDAGMMWSRSSWQQYDPNMLSGYQLYWYQTLWDRKVELKIGYYTGAYDWMGNFIGGSLWSVFGFSSSIPAVLGLNPINSQPAAKVKLNITGHVYAQVGVMRSLGIDGPTGNVLYDDTKYYNRSGYSFTVPNGKLLVMGEAGWKNEAAPGLMQNWVRAGFMYNNSRFQNFKTGTKDAGVPGGYILADRQLLQLAPGSELTAYRGLYVGGTAMYAPPQYASFYQYYEARLYALGLFASRPRDLISFSYNRNVFSGYVVNNINRAAATTGLFSQTHGANAYTLSGTARVYDGIYLSLGLSYVDKPSLTYPSGRGNDHALNVLFAAAVSL